jgi:hypothetical protein
MALSVTTGIDIAASVAAAGIDIMTVVVVVVAAAVVVAGRVAGTGGQHKNSACFANAQLASVASNLEAAIKTTTTVMMSMPAAATEAAMSMPVVTESAMSMPTVPEATESVAPVYPGEEEDEVEVMEVEDKELPPAPTPAASGAMTMETTLAALTVAGAMMLV